MRPHKTAKTNLTTPGKRGPKRQDRFIDEYLANERAPVSERVSQSMIAVRAGYSPHTAKQHASFLLTSPDMQARIEAKRQRLNVKVELTQEIATLESISQYKENKESNPVIAYKWYELATRLQGLLV